MSTKKKLTEQEIFDNAIQGIRKQGYRRCVTGEFKNTCVYINPNDDSCRCAIGHSLEKEECIALDAGSDDGPITVEEMREYGFDPPWGKRLDAFAAAVQDSCHDCFAEDDTPEDMEGEWKTFADHYPNVTYTPPKAN
jgi:hypothetical protein